jgi:hypothetical protein
VEGGKVLFEQGPRSLRPGMPRGVHTAALVCFYLLALLLVFDILGKIVVGCYFCLT